MVTLSELGLFPLSISAVKATVEYWDHFKMKLQDNLAKRAYNENLTLYSFCNKFRIVLEKIGFGHVWQNQSTFFKKRLSYGIINILTLVKYVYLGVNRMYNLNMYMKGLK